MAACAIFRRWLVKQDLLALNLALQFVALGATHICVPALKWKLRAFIVIKSRGSPALNYMTVSAFRDPILRGELAPMRIGMACFTVLWRALELDFMRTRGCLMAIATYDRTVSPEQRKFCLRMVKTTHVDPGPRVVASLATQ